MELLVHDIDAKMTKECLEKRFILKLAFGSGYWIMQAAYDHNLEELFSQLYSEFVI